MKHLTITYDNPTVDDKDGFHIFSRKYLGKKIKFFPAIRNIIEENGIKFKSLMEPCMGTGVISYQFATEGKQVYANDLLPLNYIMGSAFMGGCGLSHEDIQNKIKILNEKKGEEGNITKKYGDTFVPLSVSKKIDVISNYLKTSKLTPSEKKYLTTSLLCALEQTSFADSDFLGLEKINPPKTELYLQKLMTLETNSAQVTNMDAGDFVEKYTADLCIVDPPFHEVDYSEYMDFPNYIISQIFPEIEQPGKSAFCDINQAENAFRQLISRMNSKNLIFFYSEDGIVTQQALQNIVSAHFKKCEIYRIKRKRGLHLIRNEPKTDFAIVGLENK